MYPEIIILDVQPEFHAVKEFAKSSEYLQGFCDHEHLECCVTKPLIQSILEYIADKETAYGCLLEYINELREIYPDLEEQEMEYFCTKVRELGVAILEQLIAIKAYDPHGALWYQIEGIAGDDIVLRFIKEGDRLHG